MHRKLLSVASVALLMTAAGCLQAADPRDAIEGSWEPLSVESAAGPTPTLRYQLEGDRLHMTSSAGRSYAADINGAPVKLKGAPPGTTVSVRRIPAVAYREVVMRDGRPVAARIVTVADKNVATVFENRLDGSAAVQAAVRR